MPADRRLPARVPRRTALSGLAGLTGLVVVAGCDDKDTPTTAPTPSPDPDTVLVDRVLRHLAKAERLALSADQRALANLHATHIAALEGTPATPPAPGHAPVTDLRRHEQRLQHQLANAAAKAESGDLARLLASMSAAVSQQLAAGAA